MKKVIVFSVIFLINLSLVLGAANQEGGEIFEQGTTSFDSDTFNYETDPIADVPPDQVDVDKVQEFDRENDLSVKQLTHQNPDGTFNIDQFDSNKLDPKARDEALKLLGRAKEVESEIGNQNTQITTFDNGWAIDNILLLTVDGIHIINGQGITYRDNNISVEYADTLYTRYGMLNGVTNFSGTSIEFNVGQVNQLQDGCIAVYDLHDSRVVSTDKTLEINPHHALTFSLSDCGKTETVFKALSNESSLTLSKGKPPQYNLKKGILTCSFGNNLTDSITANISASLDLGSQCFNCMTIEPVGRYWHTAKNLPSNFGIHVPENSSSYKLCLQRLDGRPYTDYDGLVDFTTNTMELNGIVDYLRMPFELILDDFILLPPFTPVPVYASYDPDNMALLELDNKILFVDNFLLTNEQTQPSVPLSDIGWGRHQIQETGASRLLNSTSHWTPKVLKHYQTNFDNATLQFNTTIVQQGNSQVKVLGVNSLDIAQAQTYLQTYWDRIRNVPLIDYLIS